jgi:hypothetical protein
MRPALKATFYRSRNSYVPVTMQKTRSAEVAVDISLNSRYTRAANFPTAETAVS